MPNPSKTAKGELTLTSEAPGIVLDTNVVLDWLLFADASVATLSAAVIGRQVRWLATPGMRAELVQVLERGLAETRGRDAAPLLAAWDARAVLQPEPPSHRLRCTDPTDQCFVDLALASRARWLLSRDRALLKLARRALALGLRIVSPPHWRAQE